jgi:multidrug efflux system outer membrane protein
MDDFLTTSTARTGWLASRLVARARLALLACALAPSIAACIPSWQARDTAIAPPAAFRAHGSDHARELTVDWPKAFGSREFAGLIEAANRDNLDIAAASARIRQAAAQAQIARSFLFPVLDASGDASRTRTPGTSRSVSGPFRDSQANLFSLGLNASYEADFWGRNSSSAEAARLLGEASRFDRDVVTISTVASVANTYFALLAAQDRLKLGEENVATASRVLDAIRGRLSVGTATALDLAEQESVVAAQRANLPALEQQIQQNRNLLAVLLGREPESFSIRGGGLATVRVPTIAAGLPSTLLTRRPDVAAAEARLASASADVASARAAFLPTMSLTGRGGLTSAALKNLFDPHATAASMAAGLTQPIFNAGNLQGQFNLQAGRYDELHADYRRIALTALSDVENALIAIDQTARHQRLQEASVEASQRAYTISEQRLREGTIDIVTLLTVQQSLFQAQDLLVQVRLSRLQAVVSLMQALGGGFSARSSTASPETPQ